MNNFLFRSFELISESTHSRTDSDLTNPVFWVPKCFLTFEEVLPSLSTATKNLSGYKYQSSYHDGKL